MKDSYQGRMRVLIESVKAACITLAEKANVTEDPIYWKNRNTNSERKNMKLKERLDQLEIKVKTLEKNKKRKNPDSASDEDDNQLKRIQNNRTDNYRI